jgi:hypothetical protein
MYFNALYYSPWRWSVPAAGRKSSDGGNPALFLCSNTILKVTLEIYILLLCIT